MTKRTGFSGFPKECVEFFEELKMNNDKMWFVEHKKDFENYVIKPAKDFVVDMGYRLRKIAPNINAEPRVNGSIFRIYRDVRFSRKKMPYKTHIGIFFWEGRLKKLECSGFYFHLEPPNLMIGTGIYMFPKPVLEEYRESVVHSKHGPTLTRIVRNLTQKYNFYIGGAHYKRIPHGYDPEHKNAELLRNNGLWAGIETKIPKELYTADIVKYCFDRYRQMAPLHKWLLAVTEKTL